MFAMICGLFWYGRWRPGLPRLCLPIARGHPTSVGQVSNYIPNRLYCSSFLPPNS